MRHTIHFYNERGEFAFFRLGYRNMVDAVEDACDELTLPMRRGYKAEVRGRINFQENSFILANINSAGEISYVNKEKQ